MRVGDVLTERKRLMLPVSFKGRGEKRKTHILFPVADDGLDAKLTDQQACRFVYPLNSFEAPEQPCEHVRPPLSRPITLASQARRQKT
jgi:hypothetical protein